ncbi:BTAD domain-containing putative transcriptional regulator [Kribbella sandramycini]|uniref:BTAD domain-containing putative transcriptional regulator n=1 Tax=Kribbella sandramycini TaxID=60450 RepID=UPI0031E1EE34
MLGPLAMWAADGSPLDIRGARLRGLLTRLALSAGRPVSVEALVDGLWGSEAPSANALQSLVSRLRSSLPATESSVSVQSGPAGYTLTIAPDCVDVLQFEDLVRRGRAVLASDPEQAHTLLTQADRLWRGEALVDLRDLPFAAVEADRLAELRLGAVEDLAEAAISCGRSRELSTDLDQLALAHPLRERLHELLIRALYADGRQAEALTAYERVRTTLADELGADPGARLREVHLAVLRGAAVDPAPAAPAAQRPEPRSNLRAPLTSFVGRRDDVAELSRLLSNGTRLVTMVGPGGAGKTRLATETGRTLVEQSGDGIWLVELAPLGDAADVAPAVLSALGASEFVDATPPSVVLPKQVRASRAATARLVEVIADRRILLVLDNCEHLVQEVAGLVDSLLAACPRLRILTTSREPLSIPGEYLHPVGSLGLPPEDAASDEYPALQLFVDRARAVRPDFALTAANRSAVAEICRRLDGMPLAIELAAARLRALTPLQIVDRLTDRFRLLTSGSRTALPRHQTLRAVVEWSWDLLDADEQAVARRLALFSGGATLEAAEQVCSDDELPADAVLGVLASLVDKSLVEAVAGERSVRYRMLETVRAYGVEQLEAAGERERFRQQHTDYFSRLLRQASPRLRTGAQVEWIARLKADHDNLTDALRSAVDTGSARVAVQMVSVLAEFWNMSGRPTEAVGWMRAALAVPGPSVPVERAITLMMLAFGTMSLEDDQAATVPKAMRCLAEVRRLARQHDQVLNTAVGRFTNAMWAALRRDTATSFRELELARELPDPWTRHLAALLLGMYHDNEGNAEQMAADLEVAIAGFRGLGDRWGLSLALQGLASYQAVAGDHVAALASLQESMGLSEELGSSEGVGRVLGAAAISRTELGDLDGARADQQLALRMAQENGSREGEAMALFGLSRIEVRAGLLDEAKELVARSEALLGPNGPGIAPQAAAMMHAQVARIAVRQGDLAAALIASRRAVEVVLTSSDMPVTSLVVETIAEVELVAGDPERAARTLGLAAALRGMRTVPDADVRAVTEQLRAALGAEAFETAYGAGATLGRDDALAELGKRFSS